LDLSNNSLAVINVDDLLKLQHLARLDFSSNALKELPAALCLPTLISLLASHNQLACLPEALADCTALQTLRLSHNQLATLPPALGFLPQLRKVGGFCLFVLGVFFNKTMVFAAVLGQQPPDTPAV
jgi:Leucine-rich repeat (LRR) protein